MSYGTGRRCAPKHNVITAPLTDVPSCGPDLARSGIMATPSPSTRRAPQILDLKPGGLSELGGADKR